MSKGRGRHRTRKEDSLSPYSYDNYYEDNNEYYGYNQGYDRHGRSSTPQPYSKKGKNHKYKKGKNYGYNNGAKYGHNNQYQNGNRNHSKGRRKQQQWRPKTPSPPDRRHQHSNDDHNSMDRAKSAPPPKQPRRTHTKHKQQPQQMIIYLQTLSDNMLEQEQKEENAVNIRNMGLYLKKAVNGYQNAINAHEIKEHDQFILSIADEIYEEKKKDEEIKQQEEKPNIEHKEDEIKSDKKIISVKIDANDGLVQFGTNIRKFGECYCNYLAPHMNTNLEKEQFIGLREKITILIRDKNQQFPNNIKKCVKTTNQLVHTVDYGQDASAPYLNQNEREILLKQLCQFAEFVEDKLVDNEGIERVEMD